MGSMKMIKAPSSESSGRPPSLEGGNRSDMAINQTPPSSIRGSSKVSNVDPNPLLGRSTSESYYEDFESMAEKKSSLPVRWATRFIRAFQFFKIPTGFPILQRQGKDEVYAHQEYKWMGFCGVFCFLLFSLIGLVFLSVQVQGLGSHMAMLTYTEADPVKLFQLIPDPESFPAKFRINFDKETVNKNMIADLGASSIYKDKEISSFLCRNLNIQFANYYSSGDTVMQKKFDFDCRRDSKFESYEEGRVGSFEEYSVILSLASKSKGLMTIAPTTLGQNKFSVAFKTESGSKKGLLGVVVTKFYMFQSKQTIDKVSPQVFQTAPIIVKTQDAFTIGTSIPANPIVNMYSLKHIENGNCTGFVNCAMSALNFFDPIEDHDKTVMWSTGFEASHNDYLVSNQQLPTASFFIDTAVDFYPQVTEHLVVGPMTALLRFGAFKSVLEIIIAIITSVFVYRSFKNFVARQIREDILFDRKKQMERISIRDNERNPQNADGLELKEHLGPVPNVYEVERRYNQRMSPGAMFRLHDELDEIREYKAKIPALESKVNIVQGCQFEMFDLHRENQHLR